MFNILSGQNIFNRTLSSILEMPRSSKRFLLACTDFILIFFSLWIVTSLRYGFLYQPESYTQKFFFVLAPTIAVVTFAWMKLYRLVTRYLGFHGFGQIFLSMMLSVLIWSTILFLFNHKEIPRSIIFPFALLATLSVVFSRYIVGIVLRNAGIKFPQADLRITPRNILIFGANELGIKLFKEIGERGEGYVVAFIDSSKTLQRQTVMGTRVCSPKKLASLVHRHDIKEVVLALPQSNNRERLSLVRELEKFNLKILLLPNYEVYDFEQVHLDDLREVDITDLLNRESVKPDPQLLKRSISGKSILVTGAGGSIGSELVRQIIQQNPSRLILLDISEYALYQIEMELMEILSNLPKARVRPEIHGVLGSVVDSRLINEVIRAHSINTIYHAAAYKHVPIVEENIVTGVENNAFGMKVIAQEAIKNSVDLVVLVSTDKAVRPSNVMGASKRLAELILQSYSEEKTCSRFAIVRFGNVLDSSGSVISRFRKQISSGGPVTVTHKEITRYFMSIPEAASLVIQAGGMAHGGEVFLLDMGDPLRIDDLARQMIRLSGLKVRDENNSDGDIEIIYTGLRPGEKLYEELLITPTAVGTEHPRILRSQEPFLEKKELEKGLDLLQAALNTRDKQSIKKCLMHLVEDYRPTSGSLKEKKKAISTDGLKMIH